jgi:hypothetical protein
MSEVGSTETFLIQMSQRRGRVGNLIFLLNIWEVSGSNLGPEAGYSDRGFSWFFSVSQHKYPD